ncbi:hypothetical protein [Streptomyces sp. NPDC048295]|uniref:hypothetical protein n=1 Tax=Streptomyces sp. NPDC048295 TaxID=3154617 RepID=UPI003422AB9F
MPIKQNALRDKDRPRRIADMWKIPLWLLKRVLCPNFSDPPSPRNMMTEQLNAKLRAYSAHDVTPNELVRDSG